METHTKNVMAFLSIFFSLLLFIKDGNVCQPANRTGIKRIARANILIATKSGTDILAPTGMNLSDFGQ